MKWKTKQDKEENNIRREREREREQEETSQWSERKIGLVKCGRTKALREREFVFND